MTKISNYVHRGIPLQLKLEHWPKLDRQLWLKSLEAGDILSPGGAAAHWRPATRTSTEKGYGRWLAWLKAEALLDETQHPAARLTETTVAAYVAYLRDGLASVTVCTYFQAMRLALAVMEPASDLAWFWAIVRRLERARVPTRRKVGRIVKISKLYALGCARMDEVVLTDDPVSLASAVAYRTGLMTALLAQGPVRMRNLQSLTIGEQLIEVKGIYHLRFRGSEMKNHKALEFPLPRELGDRIGLYIAKIRPILLARACPTQEFEAPEPVAPGLWISMFGTTMTPSSIYEAISNSTRNDLGRHVNPHLFRDCAATSIALEDPAQVQITASILGHTTLQTSERHYNHALAIRAFADHQLVIQEARAASKRKKKLIGTMAGRVA